MTESPIRTFIALELSQSLRDRIDVLQRRLEPEVPPRSVRWVPPRNIHVTLFFIGDMMPSRLPAVRGALNAVAKALPSVTFKVKGLGAFPNVRKPRVVWVGIEHSRNLVVLHSAVNEAMGNIGFKPETRPFSPHLTIARVGRRVKAETARGLGKVVGQAKHDPGVLGSVTAQEIVLYQSTLKPTGAEYTALNKFPFSE